MPQVLAAEDDRNVPPAQSGGAAPHAGNATPDLGDEHSALILLLTHPQI